MQSEMSDEFPDWPGSQPKLESRKEPEVVPKHEPAPPQVTPQQVAEKTYKVKYEELISEMAVEHEQLQEALKAQTKKQVQIVSRPLSQEEFDERMNTYNQEYKKKHPTDWPMIGIYACVVIMIIALAYLVGSFHSELWAFITRQAPPTVSLPKNLT